MTLNTVIFYHMNLITTTDMLLLASNGIIGATDTTSGLSCDIYITLPAAV